MFLYKQIMLVLEDNEVPATSYVTETLGNLGLMPGRLSRLLLSPEEHLGW